MPIFGYPHTNYSEIDLDYVIKLVRQNNGLHLDISGNQLLLKTLDGTTVSSVTVHYAETAGHADTATTANTATFAVSASTATSANTATEASHALTADNATTAGTATTATSATTASTANNAVHATSADTALLANRATLADNATHADTTDSVVHAEKAVETISISGNTVVFRTYDGTEYTVTIPYAVKANKDDLGNVIKNTYFTNVVDNNGTLEFYDAEGNILVSLVPSSETAENDTYNNLIADYIKTIAVSSNSNYVTITHGTGTADTVIIHYAETAWKDTNDNVIKNTYIKSLGMVEDSDTGHYNLVAYNGDTPTAELFRLELIAYRSQIADEATHASTADYATSAGHANTADTATTATSATTADSATTATSATTADTCTTSALFIDCYDNHDNSGSYDDQNTLTVTGIYDALGNSVSLDTITADDKYNVYFKYRQSDGDIPTTIAVQDSVQQTNSPVMFNGVMTEVGDDGTNFVLMNKFITVGIKNGSVVTTAVYSEDITIRPNT